MAKDDEDDGDVENQVEVVKSPVHEPEAEHEHEHDKIIVETEVDIKLPDVKKKQGRERPHDQYPVEQAVYLRVDAD